MHKESAPKVKAAGRMKDNDAGGKGGGRGRPFSVK